MTDALLNPITGNYIAPVEPDRSYELPDGRTVGVTRDLRVAVSDWEVVTVEPAQPPNDGDVRKPGTLPEYEAVREGGPGERYVVREVVPAEGWLDGQTERDRQETRQMLDAAYAQANLYGLPFDLPEGSTVGFQPVPAGTTVHLPLEHPSIDNYWIECEGGWRRTPDAVQPNYDCFLPDNLTGLEQDMVRFSLPKSSLDDMFAAVIARGVQARNVGRDLEALYRAGAYGQIRQAFAAEGS